ncbi:hypothetical protein JTB14_013073 [Gonioctena quinquepunctata]|nr:hypothetical protein JTB14_013073 [Gonioctena quinquepunctata]
MIASNPFSKQNTTFGYGSVSTRVAYSRNRIPRVRAAVLEFYRVVWVEVSRIFSGDPEKLNSDIIGFLKGFARSTEMIKDYSN